MAVAILSNGVVEKRTIGIRHDVPDTVLSSASAVLQQRLSESSLGKAPAGTSTGDGEVDDLVRACVDAFEDTNTNAGTDQVFVGGAAHMAERFDAIDQVRAVLGILEQSYVVVTLLRDVLAQGQSVSIGSEHAGVESLAECSLVVAPYESDGVAFGTIGVLGPTRMDYQHALAAVAVVGQRLTRELRGN
jgi:heat-inducible transcriptional repressor